MDARTQTALDVALGSTSAATPTTTPTPASSVTTTDLGEDPVEDLPELPAEIWTIIWWLVAAQGGFVGARRLMGDAICKAATEGWGFRLFFPFQFSFWFLIFSQVSVLPSTSTKPAVTSRLHPPLPGGHGRRCAHYQGSS